MRAGAKLVWSFCMLMKIWLEDMVRVSFDALEKVVVSSIEQFGDDRHVASTVTTNQDVRGRRLNTCQTTMVPRTGCAR